MPFLFAYVCDLLEKLEEPFLREVGYLPGRLHEYIRNHTSKWFMMHRKKLDAHSTDANAVLSIFWPQRQTDRIYGLDQAHLEMTIARALQLSKLQFVELQSWRTDPLKRDLAFFVQRVMKNTKTTAYSAQSNKVMVEDIDDVLLQIASFNPESSLEVQSLANTPGWTHADHVTLLGDLYQQLQPQEAKWLTRLVLKNLDPLKVPDDLDLCASSGHSNLPQCLKVSIKIAPTATSTAIRREGPKTIRGTALDNAMLKPKEITGQGHSLIVKHLPLTPPTSSPALPVQGFLETASRSALSAVSGGVLPYPLEPLSPTLSVSLVVEKPANKPSVSAPSGMEAIPSSAPTPYPKAQKPSRPILGELSSNTTNSQRSLCSQGSSSPKNPHIINGTGSCQLNSKACPLKHCIFILSPCIASHSNSNFISLLSWHGCHYITSISALNHPSVPRRCPQTSKRYRRIVLVESNRTKQTAQFLRKVATRRMREAGNKERDWICVYDWRLLESIGKADQGKALSHNPWVRLFIGKV